MRSLQRAGGIAAHIASGTFVAGLLMLVLLLGDFADPATPADAVAELTTHGSLITVWVLVTTVVFGAALVPLSLALRQGAGSDDGSELARVAAPFGLIWAGVIIAAGMVWTVGYHAVSDLAAQDADAAGALWRTVDTVGDGLGGGNEVVGAIWVILASVAAWQARALPRWIAVIGAVAGAAGLATLIPGASDAGAVFGIGMIVWFTAVGTVLTSRARKDQSTAAATQPVQAR